MLIILEGTNQSIVSRQTQLLKESLIGGPREVVTYNYTFPDNYESEELSPQALLILKLGQMELSTKDIMGDVYAGKYVIVDRYIFSVIAEQAAKGFKYAKSMRFLQRDRGLFPLGADMVFHLDTPTDDVFLKKVRKQYRQISKHRTFFRSWFNINATKKEEKVTAMMAKAVMARTLR